MGDRTAQNELYKEYYSYGLNICIRYVKDNLEARSVLNEGFYKVFKNIKSFNQELDFKPWLKTIMINSSLDYKRKNEKIRYLTSIEQDSNLSINPSAIANMAMDDMLKVISLLPSAYGTVFNLFVIDGYKHSEISTMLNIDISTSKSNLSRAKKKLRDMLKVNVAI